MGPQQLPSSCIPLLVIWSFNDTDDFDHNGTNIAIETCEQ